MCVLLGNLYIYAAFWLHCVAFACYYYNTKQKNALFLTVNRKLLLKVDYSLLFTFIFFFIFVGNAGCIEAIRNFISEIVIGREIIVAAFLSQGLSNVPATVMLAGFTDNAIDLLKGVTLGGLGTDRKSVV